MVDIPTPSSRLPLILKRLAYKALNHYGWYDAGYSSAHLVEDLIQVGYIVCLKKASDRIRLDIYNAMGDYILLWYAGVTKCQEDRIIKFRVIPEAQPDSVVVDPYQDTTAYNVERQTKVSQCIFKLKTQISAGPVFNFSALQALVESGQGRVSPEIREKYGVTKHHLNAARNRGKKILQECI